MDGPPYPNRARPIAHECDHCLFSLATSRRRATRLARGVYILVCLHKAQPWLSQSKKPLTPSKCAWEVGGPPSSQPRYGRHDPSS